MNTPNPLVPQGALTTKGNGNFRITVLATVAVHVVLLCVLLIAGCNKKDPAAEPVVDPNAGAVLPPVEPPVWPTNPPPVATSNDIGNLPPPVTNTPPPPPPIPDTPPVATTAETEHTIAKNETLATIAKKHGVGWKAIEAANPGINPTRLKIGDKIKIPAAKTPAATTTANGFAPAPVEGTTKTYAVKSGDNLSKIAKNHGVTPKAIRMANKLKTDRITVGQKLKIPAKPGAPVPTEAVVPVPVPEVPAPTPPPVATPIP